MKLTKGVGTPETGGCWMAAIDYYTRGDLNWNDHPECVDPLIRRLCIGLNDRCEDGEREELIGPHLLTPVGTRDDSLAKRRLEMVVEFAKEIRESAYAAAYAAAASDAAAAAYAAAASDAAAATDAAAYAAAASDAAAATYAAADAAAASAAYAAAASASGAAAAADAAADALKRARRESRKLILKLILDLCDLSAIREIVPAKSEAETLRVVCKVTA